MTRFVLAFLFLAALPLRAERIRVVVALQPGQVRLAEVSALHAAARVERWGKAPVYTVEIDRSELAALLLDPRVRAATVDEGGRGGLLESLPVIGANVLHQRGFDGRGITIAVLDSGIDREHPDFAGRIIAERCFCDNLNGGCCPGGDLDRSGHGAAEDDHGHGTHVTGIAAGGGAVAPAGVAPRASIVAVKVLDSQNRFRSFTQIYRALQWIADARPDVDVINMSLGSDALFQPSQCGAAAIAIGLQPVIAQLRERGVLIAASTGNNGQIDRMWIPACMDEVLGVGATYDAPGNHCGTISSTPDDVTCFTNSSLSMDLLAPGNLISASGRLGGVATLSGTSMAAPHVAGTIALIKQAGGRALSATFIQDLLTRTSVPVLDARNQLTFPRIDALAAVSATPPAQRGPRRRAVRR